ncbi:MAG: TlpA family protein disulfide reductase [Candidatus Eremiobacteraeota bacterium]|nr:TlpA family protein disulfide reductase [Candidatus Eremiobacteraeota bacterium]
MKRWAYAGLALALAIALVVNFRASGTRPAQSGSGPESLNGSVAPSFPLKRFDGRLDALDRYRGKLVIMNLWASWCPPCRAEMPDLQRLAQRYGGRGLVVLGVDEGESSAGAREFARSLGIDFPILLDQEQRYGRVYAVLGLPTTIIIRPNGTVARGIDGALTYNQMRDIVTPLLAK